MDNYYWAAAVHLAHLPRPSPPECWWCGADILDDDDVYCPVCEARLIGLRAWTMTSWRCWRGLLGCQCGYSFTEIPTTTTEPRPTDEPTPISKAEAAREELEKFAEWIGPRYSDNWPKAFVEKYLEDVRNGWKPEA